MKRVVQLVSPVRCPFTNIILRPLRNEISSLFPRSRAISLFLSLSLCPYSNLAKVKLFIKRGIHFKWAGQSTAAYQLNDLIRIQRCDFPFSFVLLFWKGRRWISTTTYLPPRSRYRKSRNRKVYFSIAFPPTLYLFTQRRVSFGHLPTRLQILIVSERMSSDVDPPRWLRCSAVSRMRRHCEFRKDIPIPPAV